MFRPGPFRSCAALLSSGAVLVVAFWLLGSPIAGADDPPTNPPLPTDVQPAAPVPVAAGAVRGTLLHPWGDCGPANGWALLNANWPSYGATPLSIDETTFCDRSVRVTYSALVANDADVLVLSDPAGGRYHFRPSEVAAIARYARDGHNILATFLTLCWCPTRLPPVDDRALAPVLGLPATSYTGGEEHVTPAYAILRMSPLFRNVPDPYSSSGFPGSQRPASGVAIWTKATLRGAKIAAITADKTAAILTYRKCTYRATYITNMPEYSGSTTDQQFLYNALTRPKPKSCVDDDAADDG